MHKSKICKSCENTINNSLGYELKEIGRKLNNISENIGNNYLTLQSIKKHLRLDDNDQASSPAGCMDQEIFGREMDKRNDILKQKTQTKFHFIIHACIKVKSVKIVKIPYITA